MNTKQIYSKINNNISFNPTAIRNDKEDIFRTDDTNYNLFPHIPQNEEREKKRILILPPKDTYPIAARYLILPAEDTYPSPQKKDVFFTKNNDRKTCIPKKNLVSL